MCYVEKDRDQNALGIQWDIQRDTLSLAPLAVTSVECRLTKKSLLSANSSLLAPLGPFSHVTINGKIILKKLWQGKLSWDEPPLEEFDGMDQKYFNELSNVPKITVARTVKFEEGKEEFHIFSDAS